MANVLKTIAIAAGAGVAFGLCATFGSSRARRVDSDGVSGRIDAQEAAMAALRAQLEAQTAAIGSRLEAELERRHNQSFAVIEQTVELRISERISAIERTLRDQSASIATLRDRAQDTDTNMKRLISAVEKLCETSQKAAPVTVASDPFPEFRSSIFLEPDAPKKPRFPLARILGMVALIVLSQLLTR